MAIRSIANVLGYGLVLISLNGCAYFDFFGKKEEPVKPIQVTTKPIEKPKLNLPKVDKITMKEVEWIIITEDNYQQVFDELKKTGRPLAVFGLTDQGYKNLGLNLSYIRALLQQHKVIIAAYENYYQQANKVLDNAVTVDKNE